MEYIEQEEYLLLNFKDKLDLKFFDKPNLFFKVVNLESTPFIQIGNHVFSAKYEEVLGTSLIFEEDEQQNGDVYDKETQIHLKYLGKTCKSLMLQHFKMPDELPGIEESELVDLKFAHSYETVLKQLEDGSLDIKDIIAKPNKMDSDHIVQKVQKESKMATVNKNTTEESSSIQYFPDYQFVNPGEACTKNVMEESYTLLKDLVHQQVHDPEYYNMLEGEEFKNKKQYEILKGIYLKSCDYKKLANKVSKSPVDYVDLQASIRDGVVRMKSKFNEDDMKRLFSMDNFDNFNVELKIIVLTDYLKEEKAQIAKLSELELQREDEFGRTARKRYKMVKTFVKDLKYNLFVKTNMDSSKKQ